MNFTLKIIESEAEISKKINQAILKELSKKVSKSFNKLRQYILSSVISSIRNQPEYASILSGSLKGEFGIPNPSQRLNAILEKIESSLFTDYKKPFIKGNGISGGFSIGIIKSDFSDILSMSEAVIISEKNTSLEWLKWLLLEGDKTIITGYEFQLSSPNRSRSGKGIMSPSFSGVWKVPGAFSGTMENNWLTRAVESVSKDIESYFIDLLQKT